MTLGFTLVGIITLAGAIGAVVFRQIVHSVLSLALAFTGVAMLYLQLDAQFLGFAQFLVYIGAVTILILFAILLTRNTGPSLSRSPFSNGWASGVLVSAAVFGALAWAIRATPGLAQNAPHKANASVKAIGEALLNHYVIPLEMIALLLTAAMVGAVVIAMNERPSQSFPQPSRQNDVKGS